MILKNIKKLTICWLALSISLACAYSSGYFMLDSIKNNSDVIICLILITAIAAAALNFILYLRSALNFVNQESGDNEKAQNVSERIFNKIITFGCAASTAIFSCYSLIKLKAPIFNIIICTFAAFILTIFLLDFNLGASFNKIAKSWKSCKSKLRKAFFIILSMIFTAANVGIGITTFDSIKECFAEHIKNKTVVVILASLLIFCFLISELSFTIGIARKITMKPNKNTEKTKLTLSKRIIKYLSNSFKFLFIASNSIGNGFIAKHDAGGIAIATSEGILSGFTMYNSIKAKKTSMFDLIGENATGRVFLSLSVLCLASTMICWQFNAPNLIIWLPITIVFAIIFGIFFIFTNTYTAMTQNKEHKDSSTFSSKDQQKEVLISNETNASHSSQPDTETIVACTAPQLRD